MKQMKRGMGLIAAAILGFACLAQADDMNAARERRKARKDQVVELVQSGAAEEGNDGYLAAKAGLSAAQSAVVKAENADRKIGYEAIAKANGKAVEEVAKQAAAINKARAAKK
jgi:uncharacterized protein YdbL (DUF1318 family)